MDDSRSRTLEDGLERDEAGAVVAAWLARFGAAVARRDAEGFGRLFAADGYWRDILSFTWEQRTFAGPAEIGAAFAATVAGAGAANVRPAAGRSAPRRLRRSGRTVIEAYFDFDTSVGTGAGFVRLLHDPADPGAPRIWLLLTTLHALSGCEERIGARRPTGEQYSRIVSPRSWKDDREAERGFADRDPEVLIVGAGHSGLMLAARFRQMGVDALVIERTPRVGDGWRNRYKNLTLHNEVTANHFPYMPFPETWPVWLPKDMMAAWLEAYAEMMELNVWTGTRLAEARFDAGAAAWAIRLDRGEGGSRAMRCKHIVAAIGLSGGVPRRPRLPGLEDFAGTVVHSSEFVTGADWAGRNAVVIGTGNSGHDIAQDLHVSGARSVAIMQRGPTCVVSLDPSAMISYAVYGEGRPVEDVDLMVAAVPYPVLIETYKSITEKTAEHDRRMIAGLNAAGFRTHNGPDETGFQLLYLRGAGGYYIDVGCAELIIDRRIGVLQAEDLDRVVPDGLRMKDGTVAPCDLIVLATGFESMQEGIREMLGDAVADRVGPVWGFDENNNMRNIWRRTAQDGFWTMGGAIIEARLNSRFLALEIAAELKGLLPRREALPLATARTSGPGAR